MSDTNTHSAYPARLDARLEEPLDEPEPTVEGLVATSRDPDLDLLVLIPPRDRRPPRGRPQPPPKRPRRHPGHRVATREGRQPTRATGIAVARLAARRSCRHPGHQRPRRRGGVSHLPRCADVEAPLRHDLPPGPHRPRLVAANPGVCPRAAPHRHHRRRTPRWLPRRPSLRRAHAAIGHRPLPTRQPRRDRRRRRHPHRRSASTRQRPATLHGHRRAPALPQMTIHGCSEANDRHVSTTRRLRAPQGGSGTERSGRMIGMADAQLHGTTLRR